MGTGQMMLSVMAVFLLTTIILTSNRSYMNNTETMVQTKMNLISVAVATSQIEKVSRLAFDEVSVPTADSLPGDDIDSLPQLTKTLKTETGENPADESTFDDVDDYNGFQSVAVTQSRDTFYFKCRVSYVNTTDPLGASVTGPTWAKKVEVRVWPKLKPVSGLPDTILLTKSVGYWRWR